MFNVLNSRIILSAATILAAAGLAIGATFAFFSDTETSSGNVLAAGAIDLKIDNESYVTDPETGELTFSEGTSWGLTDLTIEKFFDFADLKPGDIGEDTISIHVNDNDAWLCAAAQITDDSDQTCTEPESADDPSCADPGLGLGELDEELNFAFWVDDGDNVLETDEVASVFLTGPLSGLNPEGKIALSDSSDTGPFGDTPIPGGETVFIGKAWCFGELTADDTTAIAEGVGTPVERGSGVSCDGSGVNNAAQTDRVMGDIQFYATQSRNNDDFLCSENYTPVWPTPTEPQ